MKQLLIFMLTMLILNGCSVATAPRYSISSNNFTEIKEITNNSKIKVTGFKNYGAQTLEACRGGGVIHMPDNKNMAEYIEQAFIDELKAAGVYNENKANITLSANLNKYNYSSFGNWYFSMTLNSSNGKTMEVEDTYNFEWAFIGQIACNFVADAINPAVQNLINKIVTSPEFLLLIQPVNEYK